MSATTTAPRESAAENQPGGVFRRGSNWNLYGSFNKSNLFLSPDKKQEDLNLYDESNNIILNLSKEFTINDIF